MKNICMDEWLMNFVSISSCLEEPAMCSSDIISTFTSRAYAFISFELGQYSNDSSYLIHVINIIQDIFSTIQSICYENPKVDICVNFFFIMSS